MNYPKYKALAFLCMICIFFSCKTDPKQDTTKFKRTDNSVIVRMEVDADQLFPLFGKSVYDSQVNGQLYNHLVGFDSRNKTFVPELTKEMPKTRKIRDQSSQTRVAYDFEILEEAVWANGSPVTGHDFLATMKVLFNPLVDAARTREVLAMEISDIQVDEENPKKLTVVGSQETYLSLKNISNAVPVLPAYILDPEGKLERINFSDLTNPEQAEKLAKNNQDLQNIALRINSADFTKSLENLVGSGPYTLTEWQPGQKIALQKKANWWGDKISETTHPTLRAYPEAIDYKPIVNEATALAALKLQEIDALNRPDNNEFKALQENASINQVFNFETTSAAAVYFIMLNTTNPKLSDKRVRQALAHALDVDEVLNTVYAGYGQRVANPLHPDQSYYHDGLAVIKPDIQKAKALLAAAGWEDTNDNGIVDKVIEGATVDLTIDYMIVSKRATTLNSALLFKDQAKRVGIDLNISQVESSVFGTKRESRDFEAMSAGSGLTPNWNPRQRWYSNGASNYMGFGTAKTDALIDEVLTNFSSEERTVLYKELQSIIYEEQPLIMLWVPTIPVIVSKRFEYDLTSDPPYYEPRFFMLKE
ncbi:MAG: ABC transporter substrate-binding protein [Bacteroidota bacterium]